jgi:hypothetical protein
MRDWRAAFDWLARARPLRRAADGLLRALSRVRLRGLDREEPARSQTVALLGLVHRARATPFGRDHDFARLKAAEDFRRLVPLSAPAETGWPPPACPDLLACHRAALRTALAFVVAARPQSRLLSGPLLFPHDEALDRAHFPHLMRPYVWSGRGEPPTHGMATLLAGGLARVTDLAERGGWPGLAAVLWRREGATPPDRLRAAAADRLLLQTVDVCGVPVAVEDPRHGLPRLLTDHGCYFELLAADGGARLPLADAVPGRRYELVLTAPAGLWACRTGELIELERLSPPLARFVGPVPAPAPAPLERSDLPHPAPTAAPAPHRRVADPPTPSGPFDPLPWWAPTHRG